MSWIEIIPDERADEALSALYQQFRDPRSGGIDEILGVHSLQPAGMAAHWAVYRAAMTPTRSLRLRDRELVGLVVSSVNACHY